MKSTSRIVRPLRKGQITIPTEFRKQLEIDEHTLLQIVLVGRELRIRPVQVSESRASSEWVRELYALFEPVRKETAKRSESEVDADIDRAVKAVRRNRAARRP